ncbi:hypothetical protein [Escherichia coli]|uniref:hypothetical protein n=1 Tax=Escherichia coli TaxID=562 RepID=UPI00259C7182|nr:hypothetical protein [Escherichia coli]MDM4976868.1 hypothetical protein [Escherichia coli]
MSERNYEAIGRCVVLRKRIEENLCALQKIKSEIVSADSPFLLDGRLCGSHSLVLSIETNANRCRELLDETMQLVSEQFTRSMREMIRLMKRSGRKRIRAWASVNAGMICVVWRKKRRNRFQRG